PMWEPASRGVGRPPGTASMRISCRLPSSSEARIVTPVVLPSGLARERTKPWSSMSSVKAKIGMLAVARCAARTAASPPARMTSTPASTRSAAWPSISLRQQRETGCIDYEILAFDEAEPPQFIEQREIMRYIARARKQAAEAINASGLLSARHERPRDGRAGEQRDELAAPHSITSSARASNAGEISRP